MNGLFLSTAICCLLGIIYFGSTAAFNAFTGVATLCLSASYGLPILILLLRKRQLVRDAPFSLGKFGFVINVIAVCWIALAIVIFCMPTAIPVTPVTMSNDSSRLLQLTYRLRQCCICRLHHHLSGLVLRLGKEAFRWTSNARQRSRRTAQRSRREPAERCRLFIRKCRLHVNFIPFRILSNRECLS